MRQESIAQVVARCNAMKAAEQSTAPADMTKFRPGMRVEVATPLPYGINGGVAYHEPGALGTVEPLTLPAGCQWMTDKTTVQIRFDGVEQPYRCARKAADFAFRIAPKTTPRKARPTIAAAVAWIALNDECAEMDADVIAGFISVVLAADLFGVSAETIAKKVVRYREEHA